MTDAPRGNVGDPNRSGHRPLGPTVAGTWYTDDPVALAREIDGFLQAAPPPEDEGGAVRALIAPHAGLTYSGAVAGLTFGCLSGARFERVLLLGPSHHAAFPGAAAPSADRYRTPLGEVDLDAETIVGLGSLPGFRVDDSPFLPEHCLESEILFLQRTLQPEWSLVPLLIGAGSTPSDVASVARGLERRIEPGTLIVVSSDFTHFGPRFGYVPFRDDLPGRIERLDKGAVERILARDAGGFADYVDRTGATICGRAAIGVLLELLPENLVASLVAYDTSGRMTGDWNHSVSYAGLVFREPSAENPSS